MTCEAHSDRYEPAQMTCTACRLSWHKDDPERPDCPRSRPLRFPGHAVTLSKPAKFCSGLPDPTAHFC
jgi:hypothetical protein